MTHHLVHDPLQIMHLSLSFPGKTCFENFSTDIPFGSRIAIIGRNGSGKSSLLNVLRGYTEPTDGCVKIPENVRIGYVPQIIATSDALSGGQRVQNALTRALSRDPNVLLLDEPTNHLDAQNCRNVLRLLQHFPGTLIVVSHDTTLLRTCIDTLWHIDNEKIHVFSGSYDDYIRDMQSRRTSIEKELAQLDRQKKGMHERLMREQERAAKSRASGKKKMATKRWMKSVGDLKGMKAEKSQGNKLRKIEGTRQELAERLSEIRLPEIVVPKFSLSASDVTDRVIVQISDGAVGYADVTVLQNVNLFMTGRDRLLLIGRNGSGKSTLARAILKDAHVWCRGHWIVPSRDDIGYFDQHYSVLSPDDTVLSSVSALVPHWAHGELRRHLNDFLFRTNAEVENRVEALSGGEKVRLMLARIAAKTPRLLVLDEITNNLDLETLTHVKSVLTAYPGAIFAISHQNAFWEEIGVTQTYDVEAF